MSLHKTGGVKTLLHPSLSPNVEMKEEPIIDVDGCEMSLKSAQGVCTGTDQNAEPEKSVPDSLVGGQQG